MRFLKDISNEKLSTTLEITSQIMDKYNLCNYLLLIMINIVTKQILTTTILENYICVYNRRTSLVSMKKVFKKKV